jgi:hypothetical protein
MAVLMVMSLLGERSWRCLGSRDREFDKCQAGCTLVGPGG